jgi:hypothetical protein
MTEARYHELLGQMLDSGLSEADAEELRRGLEADPGQLRDLREHLMLWDLWAQEQESPRGSEAFCRGFQDRLKAECERPHAVGPRPGRDPEFDAGDRRRRGRWAILGCAAGLILALTAGLLLNRPPQGQATVNRDPAPAPAAGPNVPAPAPAPVSAIASQTPAIRPVSLRGEVICTRCILHQTTRCQMAIRVHESGKEAVLFVNSESATGGNLGHAYCLGPVPVLAQGSVRSEEGHQYLVATRIDVQR